jgi:hypothetical protein
MSGRPEQPPILPLGQSLDPNEVAEDTDNPRTFASDFFGAQNGGDDYVVTPDFRAIAAQHELAQAHRPRRSAPAPVSSPLLWPGAEDQGVVQLSVYRRDASGRYLGIGQIGADATEADLIAFGREPGTYRLIAVSEHGEEIQSASLPPVTKLISADHTAFRSAPTATGHGSPAYVPVPNQLDPNVLLQALLAKTEAERAELAEERKLLRLQQEAAAKQRDSAAAVVQETSSMTTMALFNQFGEIDKARQEQANQVQAMAQQATMKASEKQMSSMAEMFTMMMAQQQAQAAAALAEADRRRAQDERDFEMRRQRERDEAEARRREDQARWDRERAEREDRLDRERADAIRRETAEAERAREHQATLERLRTEAEARRDALLAQADPLASVKSLGLLATTTILPVMKSLGIEVADLKGLLGGGGAAETKGLLSTAIETFGGIAKTYIEAQAGGGGGDDDDEEDDEVVDDDPNDPVVQMRFADGRIVAMKRSQADALLAQQQQAPAQIPMAAPAPETGAATLVVPAPPPVQVNADDLARVARQKARLFVDALESFEIGRWPDLIPEFLGGAPELVAYLHGVSVEAAMTEADAKPETTEALLNLLTVAQATGKLPANIKLKG